MKLKNTNKKSLRQLLGSAGFGSTREQIRKRNNQLFKKYGLLNQAKLTIVDNIIFLETNSIFSHVEIFYKGQGPSFTNLLPAGCYIDITNNKIYICSILGLRLIMSRLLSYQGDFKVIACNVRGYVGGTVEATIVDNDADISVDRMDANVEDLDVNILPDNGRLKRLGSSTQNPRLNDNSIKGLYMDSNIYKGYYHYWPDLGVKMTKPYPHKDSIPIIASSEVNNINIKKAKQRIEKLIKFNLQKHGQLQPRKVDFTKYPSTVRKFAETTKSVFNRLTQITQDDVFEIQGKTNLKKIIKEQRSKLKERDSRISISEDRTGDKGNTITKIKGKK